MIELLSPSRPSQEIEKLIEEVPGVESREVFLLLRDSSRPWQDDSVATRTPFHACFLAVDRGGSNHTV